MQDYRKLNVWRRAHEFAVAIRKRAEEFPRSGYADFKAQLIRAAESIANNIVEGCGAATRKEFARYLDISIKSASEVEYHLLSAVDYGIIDEQSWADLTSELVEIRKMLYGLRRTILSADAEDRKRRRARKPKRRDARGGARPSKPPSPPKETGD